MQISVERAEWLFYILNFLLTFCRSLLQVLSSLCSAEDLYNCHCYIYSIVFPPWDTLWAVWRPTMSCGWRHGGYDGKFKWVKWHSNFYLWVIPLPVWVYHVGLHCMSWAHNFDRFSQNFSHLNKSGKHRKSCPQKRLPRCTRTRWGLLESRESHRLWGLFTYFSSLTQELPLDRRFSLRIRVISHYRCPTISHVSHCLL